jgi:MFS family permease
VLILLAGGIVAATAPNNSAIIVGRTLRGWGCSGTLGGSVLMTSHVAGPKLQPMLIGMWISVFIFSRIIGPLIGGAFTSEVTWRWCFRINSPVGGQIIALVLLFFRVP